MLALEMLEPILVCAYYLKLTQQGLQRWLSSLEHWLLSQKTQL